MSPLRLALVTLLATGMLGVAEAQAGFAPANEPITEGYNLGADAVATDAAGNSIVAWSAEPSQGAPDEVLARRVGVGGELGPVIALEPGATGFLPDVAATPGGRAFAAWRSRPGDSGAYSVKGRWIETDGTLGPLLTLIAGQDGTTEPVSNQVVIDPAGVATVAWRDQKGSELGMRRVTPASILGTLVPDVSGGGAIVVPRIAALPNGSTVAVWRNSGVDLSVLSAGLVVTGPLDVSAAGLVADPEIGTDSAGNGLVAWRLSSGSNYEVRGRRLTSTGAFNGAEFVVDPPATGFVGVQIRIEADSVGDFLVSWNRQVPVNHATLFARRVDTAAVFAGPAQPFSDSALDAGSSATALFDSGEAAAIWSADGGGPIVGRTLGPLAQPLTPIGQLLDEGGSTFASAQPQLGFASFLIEYPTGPATQAAVLRRFMPPPVCADTGATVVQGLPVTIPPACTGLAIEGGEVRGAAANGEAVFDPAVNAFRYTPKPGFEGTDSFLYAGLNDGGASNPATVTIAVRKDTVKPKIRKLKLLRKGKAGKQSFRFRLLFSEPAKAKLTVKRFTRTGGKPKLLKLGTVGGKKATRKATLRVKGKLARQLRAGGRFRVVAVATDPAGNRSAAKKLSFRVR